MWNDTGRYIGIGRFMVFRDKIKYINTCYIKCKQYPSILCNLPIKKMVTNSYWGIAFTLGTIPLIFLFMASILDKLMPVSAVFESSHICVHADSLEVYWEITVYLAMWKQG